MGLSAGQVFFRTGPPQKQTICTRSS